MTRGERGAANDITDLFRQNFFVANTVLNRTDRAGFVEQMSSLLNSGAGMRAFGSHHSEFARRNFLRINGRMKGSREIGCSPYVPAPRRGNPRIVPWNT